MCSEKCYQGILYTHSIVAKSGDTWNSHLGLEDVSCERKKWKEARPQRPIMFFDK